ncbi:hypothetical protein MKK63_10975 [Methylobacterium sp. J-088]|uniref:hypothetical protein n=1 Tax=unclassified Methylobacterium TaxID=2615210 RepID=UPI001FB9E06A|nr:MULTISPECIES: hypothetical protein [unclassified Methylobacterium]MCJ2019733.1 hypothetical protein [Methylobacterium sp. E-065]MCJ2063232.1 hypothetical protein [Methylobacterium sp. J-088]
MRMLQSLAALAILVGACAFMPAVAIAGRGASMTAQKASVDAQDPESLFVRFGVAP